MRPVKVVVFPADPDLDVASVIIDGSDLGIWQAIEGQHESVYLPGLPGAMFVNAYNKTRGFQPNPRATRFVDAHVPGFARADMIMGPAICVGFDEDDEVADVHPDMEHAALAEQNHRATAPAYQRY